MRVPGHLRSRLKPSVSTLMCQKHTPRFWYADQITEISNFVTESQKLHDALPMTYAAFPCAALQLNLISTIKILISCIVQVVYFAQLLLVRAGKDQEVRQFLSRDWTLLQRH